MRARSSEGRHDPNDVGDLGIGSRRRRVEFGKEMYAVPTSEEREMIGNLIVRLPRDRVGGREVRLPDLRRRAGCTALYLRARRFDRPGQAPAQTENYQFTAYFRSTRGGVNSHQAIKIAGSALRVETSLWGGSPDALTD